MLLKLGMTSFIHLHGVFAAYLALSANTALTSISLRWRRRHTAFMHTVINKTRREGFNWNFGNEAGGVGPGRTPKEFRHRGPKRISILWAPKFTSPNALILLERRGHSTNELRVSAPREEN